MKSLLNAGQCFSLCVFAVLLGGFLSVKPGVTVAQQKEIGKLDVRTSAQSESYQALSETPIMISVIKDGAVLKQSERTVNSNIAFELPAGLYDVRLEGDGMVTLVKRGILVKAGERTDIIGGPMRTGKGAKIVEYAATGMTREEMAERIGKLESAVAEMQKARQTK